MGGKVTEAFQEGKKRESTLPGKIKSNTPGLKNGKRDKPTWSPTKQGNRKPGGGKTGRWSRRKGYFFWGGATGDKGGLSVLPVPVGGRN